MAASDWIASLRGHRVDRLADDELPFLRALEAAAPVGVYMWDPVEGRAAWSDGMFRILGITPGPQVHAAMFFERLHPDDRAQMLMALEGVRDRDQPPQTHRVVRGDGVRWVYSNSFPVRDPSGQVLRLYGALHDITDVREHAQRRELLETLLAATELAVGFGTYRFTLEPPRLEWSGELRRMLGYSAEHPVTPELGIEVVHADDRERMLAWGARVIAGETVPPLLARNLRSDGTVLWTESRSRRVERPEGPCVLGVTVDVTSRVELEAQLRHAAKMEAVGTLAAGVAHDFNNYLTVLAVQLESLRLRGAPSDDDLAAMGDAVARCTGLVRQLLTFARRQPFRPRSLDLAAEVRDVLGLFARVTGPDVSVTMEDAGPVPVHGDPAQLDGAVMNLLVNARDALAGAGRIRVEVRSEVIVPGDARLEGRPGGSYARLRIVDSGSGIPADALPRIFEPYFTTKARQGGVGLGLAAVYGTVTQHGGVIQVTSEPGRGTTFDVYLPLEERPVAAAAAGGFVMPPAGTRVLVVDDVVPVRDALAGLLMQDGYTVTTASDGAEALDRVLGGEQFDVVLSDVVMPRLDGRGLAHELAAIAPGVPVILMTGFAEIGSAEPGIQLDKPFSREQLHAAIGDALRRRRD